MMSGGFNFDGGKIRVLRGDITFGKNFTVQI